MLRVRVVRYLERQVYLEEWFLNILSHGKLNLMTLRQVCYLFEMFLLSYPSIPGSRVGNITL